MISSMSSSVFLLSEGRQIPRANTSSPTGSECAIASGVTGNVYHDNSVAPGVDYVYMVEAVNSSGRNMGGAATTHRLVMLALEEANVSVPYEGGRFEIAIKANADCVAASSEDWLDIEPLVSGGRLLGFVVGGNAYTSPRYASIEITAGTATRWALCWVR